MSRLIVTALLASVFGASLVLIADRRASAQFIASHPEQFRFRVITDEQLATPDGRSVAGGWKSEFIKDMMSNTCYLAFLSAPGGTSVVGPVACPE